MTRLDLRSKPSWMGHAECRGHDVDLWFPRPGQTALEAVAVCNRCPVQPECLEWAIVNVEDHGIWGGMSERQRVLLRRRRGVRACAQCHRTFTLGAGRFARLCDECRDTRRAETSSRYHERTGK